MNTCKHCGVEITLTTKFARPATWAHAPANWSAHRWYLHCRSTVAQPSVDASPVIETLRDRLAVVLGPGNDDRIAYAQADSVLQVLMDAIRDHDEDLQSQVEEAWDERYAGPWPLEDYP